LPDAHQRREGGRIEGVAAHDAMSAEQPHIPDLAERRPHRQFGYGIGWVVVGLYRADLAFALRRDTRTRSSPRRPGIKQLGLRARVD
jgi:hypothetical protein